MSRLDIKRRILSGVLAGAVAFTTLLGSTASVWAAKPDEKSATTSDVVVDIDASGLAAQDYSDVQSYLDNNKLIAEEIFAEYMEALEKGDYAGMQAVLLKLLKLTPTQRVHFFILKFGDYYKAHFLEPGFAYFNVAKYIATYPEVAAKFSNLSGDVLYQAVLNDYLTNGIFEGKSSCTSFDPVIAILAHPNETASAIISDSPQMGLESIQRVFKEQEGTDSTDGFKIASDLLGKIVGAKDDAAFNNLYIVKTTPSATGITDGGNGSEGGVINNRPSSGSSLTPDEPSVEPEEPEEPEDPEEPAEPENPDGPDEPSDPVNPPVIPVGPKAPSMDLSKKYKFYNGETPESEEFSYTVEYFGDVYESITPAVNKKYTVMIYACGTDLEYKGEDNKPGALSADIIGMLKSNYDLNNINVLVCVGGTTGYKSEYLDEECGNVGAGIFYLDPSALDDDTKSSMDYGSFDTINKDTLKLLAKFDPIDMGSPELLLGFIDMSTTLFEADNYGLIINDHGGGINGGVCVSDTKDKDGKEAVKKDNDSLTISEIEAALYYSYLYDAESDTHGKLSFIGFDACLMNNIDVQASMSMYADYMIGSEEVENGSWLYDKTLDAIDNAVKTSTGALTATQTEAMLKKINESYFDFHKANEGKVIQTLSSVDLATAREAAIAFDDVGIAFNNLYNTKNGGKTYDRLQKDLYFALRKARARCYENGSGNFGYVDIYDFMSRLKDNIDAISNGKVYNANSDVKYGLTNCSDAIEKLLKEYKPILFSGAYYEGTKVVIVGNDGKRYSFDSVAKASGNTTSDIWKALMGNELSGTSIYMPYTGAFDEDTLKTYADESIIENYVKMVQNYYSYATSEANRERLNRLKAQLKKPDRDTSKNKKNYESMFGKAEVKSVTGIDGVDAENKKTIKYINVPFDNPEYAQALKASTDAESATNDSIDAFTDFTDLIDTMKVCVLRDQPVMVYNETTKEYENNGSVSVVVGQIEVPKTGINGGSECVNIVFTQIDGYKVTGKTASAEGEAEATEFAVVKSMADQAEILKKLFPELDSSKWIMFSGFASSTVSGDYVSDAYHVYSFDSDNSNYTYKCSMNYSDNKYEMIGFKADQIGFDQYQVDAKGGETWIGFGEIFNVGDGAPVITKVDLTVDESEKNTYEVVFGLALDADSDTASDYYITKVTEPEVETADDGVTDGSDSEPEEDGEPSGEEISPASDDALPDSSKGISASENIEETEPSEDDSEEAAVPENEELPSGELPVDDASLPLPTALDPENSGEPSDPVIPEMPVEPETPSEPEPTPEVSQEPAPESSSDDGTENQTTTEE